LAFGSKVGHETLKKNLFFNLFVEEKIKERKTEPPPPSTPRPKDKIYPLAFLAF
jgi:hypothetical protein